MILIWFLFVLAFSIYCSYVSLLNHSAIAAGSCGLCVVASLRLIVNHWRRS